MNIQDVERTINSQLILIEQQKKTDKKQDEVIQQLKENQTALTDFFNKMIEASKQKSITPGITLKTPTLEKPEIFFTPSKETAPST